MSIIIYPSQHVKKLTKPKPERISSGAEPVFDLARGEVGVGVGVCVEGCGNR